MQLLPLAARLPAHLTDVGTMSGARARPPAAPWPEEDMSTPVRSSAAKRLAGFVSGGKVEATAAVLLLIATLAGAVTVPLSPFGLGLSLGLCLAAAGSGRWPIHCGIAVGVLATAMVADIRQQDSLALYAMLVALVACGARGQTVLRRWLTAWYCVVFACSVMLKVPGGISASTVGEVVATLTFIGALVLMSWAAGGSFYVLVQQQRSERAEALRSLRRTIARDLHDTVAYSMSLIAMRAEQGRQQGGASDEDLEFIAHQCRQAIQDLRSVLTVLRRDETDAAVLPSAWTIEPLPELIATRIERLGQRGFTLNASIEGDLDSLPKSVADTLGRVVHEACSNIARHAGPGTGQIMVSISSHAVDLAVINPTPASSSTHGHTPLGLIGMRERVEGMGGTFEAGNVGGRWILRATIPLHG